MKKYCLLNGPEVRLGQEITITHPLDEDMLELLKKYGVIEEVTEDPLVDFEVDDVMEIIAERIHWDASNVHKYLRSLYKINQHAVFVVVLKELALYVDSFYPTHIKECEGWWCIDSSIYMPFHTEDVNLENISAFRTKEEAQWAAVTALMVLESFNAKDK